MEQNEGIIRQICTSSARGTPKTPVSDAMLVADWGIQNDAHAGKWNRQVSILPFETIEEFKKKGADVVPGSFGENLVVEGISLQQIRIGQLVSAGECLLEITQVGKECHHHCAIYKKMGDCIMPRAGVFARVVSGGIIRTGDRAALIMENDPPADHDLSDVHEEAVSEAYADPEKLSPDAVKSDEKSFTCAVVTMSDSGVRGERRDESGPYITEKLLETGYDVVETLLLPDEKDVISSELVRLSDDLGVNLIITTGGTGFAPRDVTPEATLSVATRNVPGIAEIIRAESCKITKRAMLSRAVSVIRNRTLIVNLPGSRKAVAECLDIILSELSHGLNILLERDSECGRR